MDTTFGINSLAERISLADEEVRFHEEETTRPPKKLPAAPNRIGRLDRDFGRQAMKALTMAETTNDYRDPEDLLVALIDAKREPSLELIAELDYTLCVDKPARSNCLAPLVEQDCDNKVDYYTCDCLDRASKEMFEELYREEELEDLYRLRARERHVNRKMGPLPVAAGVKFFDKKDRDPNGGKRGKGRKRLKWRDAA